MRYTVMISVNDLNGLTHHLHTHREFTIQPSNPTGAPTSRVNVVESLQTLKFMIDRMFNRFKNIPRTQ